MNEDSAIMDDRRLLKPWIRKPPLRERLRVGLVKLFWVLLALMLAAAGFRLLLGG